MKQQPRVVLAAACLILPSIGLAQGPRERDVWYGYVQDGVRFGYQHVKVVRLADGNYRYTVDAKLLIDLFGSQKQEVASTGEYVVTADLRPVSLKIDGVDRVGKSQITGALEGDNFVVTVRHGNEVTKRRIPWSPDSGLVFSACIEDRLAALGKVTKTTLREIDEEGKVGTVFATRKSAAGAASTVWHLDTRQGFGGRRLTFDSEGVLESLLVELQGTLLRRCPEKQARKIVHRKIDGREVLTFPLDKPIRAPGRLRELDVRLTWKEIPFAELDLEDARQRIREKSEKDGLHTVVLELRAPAKSEDTATIPVEDPAMAPQLAETAFVKPKHAKIIAAAKQAIGEETNAMAAVRALSKWVNGYIEGDLSARTLSGPEVLECKSGKCTEYSTLFASLARAAGIPTRLALGERMLAGQWMGHMWNEAWVGRWITVDATVNEVDASFALLKFVHSDTVMGTQSVRWKLTKSLNISIDRFDLAPSELAGKYETGIVGTTYTNVDHACRIKAPGEGWTVQDKTSPQEAMVQFKLAGADGVRIHFVAFALPVGTPAKVITDNRVKMWKGMYEDFKVLKNEALNVAGALGHTTRMNGKTKAGLTNFTTDVLWVKGDSGFLIFMISLEAAHKKHMPDFEKLLAGFEFLDG